MVTYKCDCCDGTFESTRSDEEAMEEYKETWGGDMGEEKAILCHDCHLEFMAWWEKNKDMYQS